MSTSFMRVYYDKELDGVAIKVLNEAENCVFHRMRCVAGRSVYREGFLEWGVNMPLSEEEITIKIQSNLPLVKETIEKCLKYKLLERIDGVLHIVDWETDQLSKNQRAAIHKAVENGKRVVDVPEGKSPTKDFSYGSRPK